MLDQQSQMNSQMHRGIPMLRKLVAAVALVLLSAPLAAQPTPPRLVVVLVVDQMRADYIQMYGHHWTKGLRRLVDTGAQFPLAEYPYAVTVTCAGHATISTGTVPATHGMIGNGWHDRDLRKNVTCTEDATVSSVPFGGRKGVEKHGPKYLRTTTLSDEMRLQATRSPTVVGLSLKARSALTLAGHPSPNTYAVWEEDDGTWATSTAYTTTASPVIDAWAKANPVRASYGQTWDRLLPASAYLFEDAQPGEPATHLFPHQFTSKSGTPDNDFVNLWERSPWSDAALSNMAQHLVRELKLGQSPTGTDFLGVSFSALDLVGHAFGPRSHEVQDTLARLDVSIGALLDTLDAVVGRDRYVVALSADHGVAPVPEQAALALSSAGRFSSTLVRNAIEDTLKPMLGEGPHVTTISGANVYLTPGTLEKVMQTPGARDAVTSAIKTIPGPGLVYWADELTSTVATTDTLLQAARASYAPGRSGDLLVMTEPYWIAQSTGTTHGAPYGYDRRVPVLFAGPGITPGRYMSPASPADIAPTLAAIIGITLPYTDGKVLQQIVK
jgi:predicted AlkP superfamily pyrophosphatase or phosphodiesterase